MHASTVRNLFILAASVAAPAFAQSGQGVLSTGNLPSCATSCSVLSAAIQGCGGASSTSQAVWTCFCPRVYAASPGAIDSGTGLCADTCSSASDQRAAVSWFRNQCGSDNGLSEHEDSGSGSGSGSSGGGGQAGTVTATAAGGTPSSTSSSGSGSESDSGNGALGEDSSDGDWWSNHWKWIVMLIVLAIGLTLLAVGLILFRKHRQRRADRTNNSFNQGITSRGGGGPGGEMSGPHGPYGAGKDIASGSLVGVDANGHDSPARTRDAFMPYGYGYTRSESRLASRGNIPMSPGAVEAGGLAGTDDISRAGAGSPAAAMGVADDGRKGNGKRVLVRERSG